MANDGLHTRIPPPEGLRFLQLSFPTPAKDIVLIRMNDPKTLNALSTSRLRELDDVLSWYDDEPTLRVAIVTGAGRAFTAGADLREWRASLDDTTRGEKFGERKGVVPFTRRKGLKPVIAAVNGFALGGGCEFAVNCDIVIASSTAKFGLPEVHVGLAPTGGVLTRIVHTAGMQVASEMVLTGRHVTAQEMHTWGIVNRVVPEEGSLLDEAVGFAQMIAKGSPDAVIAAKAGLRQAWETADVERATEDWLATWFVKLEKGENLKEGMDAFREKRAPKWKPSKL